MKYPKIDTIWKRDEQNKFRIIEGEYSKEEFENIEEWYVTEKIDGTNIRIFFLKIINGEVEFKGRTDKAEIPEFLMKYLKEKFTLELLAPLFENAVLFGEGYGNKIQGSGSKYRDDCSFILFDAYIDGWWLSQDNVRDIASKLGIDSVPFIDIMTTQEAIDFLKSKPKRKISQKELVMEGIVARSHPLMLFRDGTPICWKLKVRDYERLEVEE